jgi:hypothetical protein
MSPDVLPLHPVEALCDRPQAGRGGFSVADLCRRWKIGADKIHRFIRSGELLAVNVASTLVGRPQWRITPESVRAFEKRRGSAPPPKMQRQRRRRVQEIDFYPG